MLCLEICKKSQENILKNNINISIEFLLISGIAKLLKP